MKYRYIFTIMLISLFALSCAEDKGNYDYVDINEITISGIDSLYNIYTAETVTIKPEIKNTLYSGNDEDYSYEWILMYTAAEGSGMPENFRVISTSKYLENFLPPLNAGKHKLYYRVTDKRTGVQWFSRIFYIQINGNIGTGFLIMSDVEGETQLNFINFYRDTLRFGPVNSPDLPPLGKPFELACFPDANSPAATVPAGTPRYAVCVLTETGVYRLNPANFSYDPLYDLSILIKGTRPEGFVMTGIRNTANKVSSVAFLLDNANNIMYYYWGAMRIQPAYGLFSNVIISGARFNISKFCALIDDTNGYVIFDEDSKSFAKIDPSTAAGSFYFPTDKETDFPDGRFKFQNTGKELIYMHGKSTEGTAATVGMVRVVMKDPATNEYFLGAFRCTYAVATNGDQVSWKKVSFTDINNVKEFEMTSRAVNNEFLYYRTDTKIYLYNIADDTQKEVFSAPTGSKISLMKSVNCAATAARPWSDHLMVFTYDPSKPADNCAKMQVFKMRTTYGDLDPAEYNGEKLEWTGFGKVISADWKDL